MKHKLFCTVTMKSYVVEASSKFEAKRKLANELNCPLSFICPDWNTSKLIDYYYQEICKKQ